ncbi:MAG TPA: hypothetical protein DET40_06320 [Lentisphaeria bacterium]|nr:MAG: hypothetical protein A2X45_17810 [Lentisphaerae bacterium GWF2_50_93]HCE43142.1 hypothetical protein [Lentisphaeria bacterium]
MIIDGHCHIVDEYLPILRRMDELGIDKTVLVGVGVKDLDVVKIDDSLIFKHDLLFRTLGVLKARKISRSRKFRETLVENPFNDAMLLAIRERPDRFYGFAFVNPKSDYALDEIRRCLDAGACGIKLALLQYPTDLSGERMNRICGIAQQEHVPVFFHQGLTRESSNASDMIKRFKDVDFIIAHAGVQYFREAVELAKDNSNIYIDTSSYIVTEEKIRYLYTALGAGKLIFGSDYPVMSKDPGEGLEKIRRLKCPDADTGRMLGLNILGLLGK